MKLKRKIAKLDEVAEALRGHYQPEGDAFVLKDEIELPDPVDVTGLTKNRDDILREKTALEQKFAGIDPEKAKAALAKAEEVEAKAKTDADKFADLETQIKSEKAAREAAEQRANQQLVRSAVAVAVNAANGRPGSDTLLLPVIERRLKVVEGSIRVFADDGTTPALDSKGEALTVPALIQSLKTQELYMPLFKADGAGGSGAPAGSGATGSGSAAKKISSGDQAAMNSNIAALASGEAVLAE